jgi:hypothetical protein
LTAFEESKLQKIWVNGEVDPMVSHNLVTIQEQFRKPWRDGEYLGAKLRFLTYEAQFKFK